MESATRNGFTVYTLRAGDGSLRADVIPELGAAVSSLRLEDGRELLYCQPFFWERRPPRTRGGCPFLFPAVGRLERGGQPGVYLFNARLYAMSIHGFAMRVPWTVAGAAPPDRLTLKLTDSDATREMYPFAFELGLTFSVRDDCFSIEQTYANRGRIALPYVAGFHPYFLTPEPGKGKEETRLEARPVTRLLYNERLSDVIGETDPPVFPVSVADPAINEVLSRLGDDREARLVYPDGLTLHVKAEGIEDPGMFPYLQFYTLPDRPFFCIEPWMGFPNALNTVQGCRWLAPDQTEHARMSVRVGR